MEPSPNKQRALIKISGEVSSGGEPKKCFSGTQPPYLSDQVFYWAYILPLLGMVSITFVLPTPKKLLTFGVTKSKKKRNWLEQL
jgi:hypothetical protein